MTPTFQQQIQIEAEWRVFLDDTAFNLPDTARAFRLDRIQQLEIRRGDAAVTAEREGQRYRAAFVAVFLVPSGVLLALLPWLPTGPEWLARVQPLWGLALLVWGGLFLFLRLPLAALVRAAALGTLLWSAVVTLALVEPARPAYDLVAISQHLSALQADGRAVALEEPVDGVAAGAGVAADDHGVAAHVGAEALREAHQQVVRGQPERLQPAAPAIAILEHLVAEVEDELADAVHALGGGERLTALDAQVRERKARKGRNPQTKEEIRIPASISVESG